MFEALAIEVLLACNVKRLSVMTYFTHRITNAVAEGLNSKIAVYFHFGELNLHPAPVTHTKVG